MYILSLTKAEREREKKKTIFKTRAHTKTILCHYRVCPWKENKRKQRSDKERREKEERKKERKKNCKITFNHRENPQQESQKDVAKKYRNTI